MVLVELLDGALQRQSLTRLLQALHEIGGSGEQDPVTVLDERVAEGGAEMRLARPARVEQQDRPELTEVLPGTHKQTRSEHRLDNHEYKARLPTSMLYSIRTSRTNPRDGISLF